MLPCGCHLQFHLNLVNSICSQADRLREGELCCLGHRKKVSACVSSKIYHRADNPWHEYLHNFVAARNTKASVAVLVLVIPHCIREQLSHF